MSVNPLPAAFMFQAIEMAIAMSVSRRRDGWFHLELPDCTLVMQLFRKNKAVRELRRHR